MPVVGGPRCGGVGIFLGFCLEGVLHADEHGLLDGPGLAVNFLCIMLKWLGCMGWPVVELCWCMGEGALKCSLILSPSVLPDFPM